MVTNTFDKKNGLPTHSVGQKCQSKKIKGSTSKNGNVGGRCKRSLRKGMTQRRSLLEFSSQCRPGDLLPYDSHDEPSLPTAVSAQICKTTKSAIYVYSIGHLLMHLAPLLGNLTNLSQAFYHIAFFSPRYFCLQSHIFLLLSELESVPETVQVFHM